MNTRDLLSYSFLSIERSLMRSLLVLLAMSIGVTSVVLLTSLGEAARRYVVEEFISLGTNLVFVLPGKSETTGGALNASLGGVSRSITIDDTKAITRHPAVQRVSPLVVGAASVSRAGLERESVIFGTTNEMFSIRQWHMQEGTFLPVADWDRASPVCVLGATIAAEFFKGESAIGQWLRIGESRFRVVGVLADKANTFGTKVEETVFIPIASSMSLFNTDSVFRTMIESTSAESMNVVSDFARETIKSRHYGEEDVTVITQDAMLETFNSIFLALTLTVAGIATISLLVAGVLIMNVMLVSVAQRKSEVGLLKALGATPNWITLLFLTEAALLSIIGALVGLIISLIAGWIITSLYPALVVTPPLWAVSAGVGVAFFTGILFGILPARRAAKLDAITALAG